MPYKAKHPHFCTLLNTGGDGGDDETAMGATLAQASSTPFAILYGIPKQPLYGGKTEDALIVYTWQKFFLTGDESWPLHFPMAKSVIKAMDALQQFAKSEKLPSLREFMITGASKRGWTTWLAAATKDKRIKAIAPMVIDTLNVSKQIPHQVAMLGKPSEEIDDYTNGGMLKALDSERGKRLMQLEDPYSYRDILTLPKLLILGTNDRYWAQDALNLYWDGLTGKKWVSYTPNSGHGLEDRAHVFASLTSFIDTIAGKHTWPYQTWKYERDGEQVKLSIETDHIPSSARLFHVHSNTTDFRDSKWESTPVDVEGHHVYTRYSNPASGFDAIFGEVTYQVAGKTFTISTQMEILGKK